jgi:hypothetical protein
MYFILLGKLFLQRRCTQFVLHSVGLCLSLTPTGQSETSTLPSLHITLVANVLPTSMLCLDPVDTGPVYVSSHAYNVSSVGNPWPLAYRINAYIINRVQHQEILGKGLLP